jgi:hypothetical protein
MRTFRRTPRDIFTFDIDGTLCSVPEMPQDHWQQLMNDYHGEVEFYQSLPLANQHLPSFIKFLSGYADIGIVTARSMRDRSITERWLMDNGIYYDWLVVNLYQEDRVRFLQSINCIGHFDDCHYVGEQLPWVDRVWNNEWPNPDPIGYEPWSEVFAKYKFQPTTELMPASSPLRTSRQLTLF